MDAATGMMALLAYCATHCGFARSFYKSIALYKSPNHGVLFAPEEAAEGCHTVTASQSLTMYILYAPSAKVKQCPASQPPTA